MNDDDDKITDIVIEASPAAPVAVEIDAEKIAQIIFDMCHTTEKRSVQAANRIIDYLIEVHSNAGKAQ